MRAPSGRNRPAPLSPEEQQARKVERAVILVHMGEIFAGRQALESADLAPRNQTTLNELSAPPLSLSPYWKICVRFSSGFSLELDRRLFLSNIRSAAASQRRDSLKKQWST